MLQSRAGNQARNRHLMEVKVNGRSVNLGATTGAWPNCLHHVAMALAPAIMEQALEFGQSHEASIEVWDKNGQLLVAITTRVQADWLRSSGRGDGLEG